MAKFIEVTDSAGKTLVNVDKIIFVSIYGECTLICLSDKSKFSIVETYEEIKAKLEMVND